MGIQSNILSFNQATGAIFPALEQCDFEAKHATAYVQKAGCTNPNPSLDDLQAVPDHIAKIIYRTDTGQALGRTGNRYGIVQNAALQEQMVQSLEQTLPAEYLKGIELEENTSGNGAFCKFTYTFPNAAEPIRQLRDSTGYQSDRYGQHHKETWLNLAFSVINSFDGSTPAIFKAEVRDISCLNSLTTGFFDTSKQRHTAKIDAGRFANFIEQQATNYKKRIEIWQAWAGRSITPEQAETCLKEAGLSLRLTKGLMEQFETEAAQRGRSLWALSSSLTFWSSHSSERFTVKGSAKKDNIAETLNARSNRVNQVIASPAFQALAA